MRSETRPTGACLRCGTPVEGAFCGQCGVKHQPALDRVATSVTASSASVPTAPARNVGAVLAIVKAAQLAENGSRTFSTSDICYEHLRRQAALGEIGAPAASTPGKGRRSSALASIRTSRRMR